MRLAYEAERVKLIRSSQKVLGINKGRTSRWGRFSRKGREM